MVHAICGFGLVPCSVLCAAVTNVFAIEHWVMCGNVQPIRGLALVLSLKSV